MAISRGPKPAVVPALRPGASVAEAKEELERAGLRFREKREPDERIPRDQVIAVDPKEGEEVASGATVTLIVSDGPALVTVPLLVNARRSEVAAILAQVGLVPVFSEINQPGAAPETVFDQSPRAGEKHKSGTTITVFVTPAPPPTTAAPPIILPTPTEPGPR